MFDFDVNKKNNLIFNGITKIDKENDEKLTGVVRDIIKRRMKILRFIDIVVRYLNHSLVLRVGRSDLKIGISELRRQKVTRRERM